MVNNSDFTDSETKEPRQGKCTPADLGKVKSAVRLVAATGCIWQ